MKILIYILLLVPSFVYAQSNSTVSCLIFDNNSYSGVSYYHVREFAVDGKRSYQLIKSISIEELDSSKVGIDSISTENLIGGLISELKKYITLGQYVKIWAKQINYIGSQLLIDISKVGKETYHFKPPKTTNKGYQE